MFTGIVEEMGTLLARTRNGATTLLCIAATTVIDDVAVGASIAVNGACLTVVDFGETSFSADAIDETLARTNLGGIAIGEAVNLERPLALGERLGGHLVQGHVDGVGKIIEPAPHLCVELPDRLCRYLVEKGSVTLDGCSLTVVAVTGSRARVEIIPHTAAVTTLGRKGAGAGLNVEVDVVARYVERLMAQGTNSVYDDLAGRS